MPFWTGSVVLGSGSWWLAGLACDPGRHAEAPLRVSPLSAL